MKNRILKRLVAVCFILLGIVAVLNLVQKKEMERDIENLKVKIEELRQELANHPKLERRE